MRSSFPIQAEVLHSPKTGLEYSLIRADVYAVTPLSKADIQRICNQREIYHNLFQPSLKGVPYSAEDAEDFLNHITLGWKMRNNFFWLLTHNERIVGTMGIKSLDGEIGYWLSDEHTGVMSLAVGRLCELALSAGFERLWALVREVNAPSIAVLRKCGFASSASENEVLRFEKKLFRCELRPELKVNHPVDYDLLSFYYEDPEDLARAWPEAKSPFHRPEWETWMNSGLPAVSLTLSLGQVPAGHLVIKMNDQDELYFCFVVLKKNFRGRGLIYELLTLAEGYILENFRQDCVYLHVDPANTSALASYEKHGFVHVTITDKNRFRMRKDLRKS